MPEYKLDQPGEFEKFVNDRRQAELTHFEKNMKGLDMYVVKYTQQALNETDRSALVDLRLKLKKSIAAVRTSINKDKFEFTFQTHLEQQLKQNREDSLQSFLDALVVVEEKIEKIIPSTPPSLTQEKEVKYRHRDIAMIQRFLYENEKDPQLKEKYNIREINAATIAASFGLKAKGAGGELLKAKLLVDSKTKRTKDQGTPQGNSYHIAAFEKALNFFAKNRPDLLLYIQPERDSFYTSIKKELPPEENLLST